MIKDATFVSLWDDDIEVKSSCKVDTDTNEVFDIEMVFVDDEDVEILITEFVEIDGEDYSVCDISDYDGKGFYYR